MGETNEEKRERIMRRLAEMLQGPAPETGGSGAAGGGMAEAIASLELGLSTEDTEALTGAFESGPDPDEAAALFRAMLESFQEFKQRSDGNSEA